MRTSVAPRSRIVAATRPNWESCASSERIASGCSRISARNRSSATGSGDDEGSAANEYLLDLEVVVEHHHVGGQPGVEASRGRRADDSSGNGRGSVDRLGELRTEPDEIPDALDHREHAAGELAVGAS